MACSACRPGEFLTILKMHRQVFSPQTITYKAIPIVWRYKPWIRVCYHHEHSALLFTQKEKNLPKHQRLLLGNSQTNKQEFTEFLFHALFQIYGKHKTKQTLSLAMKMPLSHTGTPGFKTQLWLLPRASCSHRCQGEVMRIPAWDTWSASSAPSFSFCLTIMDI